MDDDQHDDRPPAVDPNRTTRSDDGKTGVGTRHHPMMRLGPDGVHLMRRQDRIG
jgi:hypothetical protein